jgi:hypothetical protein
LARQLRDHARRFPPHRIVDVHEQGSKSRGDSCITHLAHAGQQLHSRIPRGLSPFTADPLERRQHGREHRVAHRRTLQGARRRENHVVIGADQRARDHEIGEMPQRHGQSLNGDFTDTAHRVERQRGEECRVTYHRGSTRDVHPYLPDRMTAVATQQFRCDRGVDAGQSGQGVGARVP